MTPNGLIEQLFQRRLITAKVADQLRAKTGSGGELADTEAVLDMLVGKQLITPAQADEFRIHKLAPADEEEVLQLAPLDDEDDLGELGIDELDEGSSDAPSPSSSSVLSGDSGIRYLNMPEPEPESAEEADSPPTDEAVDIVVSGKVSRSSLADPALASDSFVSLKHVVKPKDKPEAKGKRRRRTAWDSPLVLYGGGTVALLAGVGALLYFLIFRENAEATLKHADDLFKVGSYVQAEAEYERFAQKFSSHQDASRARVRLGMTKLWSAVEGSSNFANAAAVAQQVIPQIESEPAFIADAPGEEGLSEAKRELSTLLTRIAKGLAEQAESSEDDAVARERLDQLAKVLELTENTKYVPKRYRLDNDLDAVAATMDRVAQRRNREADLNATLKQMGEAISAGDVAAAYGARRELVRKYPVLIDDARLAEEVARASQAEAALVKFVAERQSAAATPASSPIVAELILAERRLKPASGGDQSPTVVGIDGALYALQSGDGAVLWRRRVGEPVQPPALVGGDVIAVERGGVVRVQGATGKLVWRLPIEDGLCSPVVVGENVVVGGASGKLYVISTVDGALIGYVSFSQPIRTPPAVNEAGDRLYLAGDQSNLYTLTTKDWTCLAVHYLGHAPGSVKAPPILASNKVIVARNVGRETAQLEVVALDERSAATKELNPIRLNGLVVTPLAQSGRRFAAVTTTGFAAVYEVSSVNDANALATVAKRDVRKSDGMARYAVLTEGTLWLADDQLARLDVLPTENQLAVRSLDRDFFGDAFDYPLQIAGGTVISVRRPKGQGGAVVACTESKRNRTEWEVALAAPPAGAPALDAVALKLTQAASTGSVFVVDRAAMTRRIQDQALRSEELPANMPPLSATLDLGRGRMVAGAAGTPLLLLARPDDLRHPVELITLSGPLACPPVAWQDGIVAATSVGQVFLYSADGVQSGTPFQPELEPDKSFNWLRPAVVGTGAKSQLAISDGIDKVYLLELADSPTPHLTAASVGDVGPSRLETQFAAVGDSVLAGAASKQLIRFTLPKLERQEPVMLGGRVAWGPHTVGAGALAATDAGDMVLVGADGQIQWRQKLVHGAPVGEPLLKDGDAFVITRDGGVVKLSIADGKETGFAELGQPLMAGPIALGERLIIAAADGTLLVVNRP